MSEELVLQTFDYANKGLEGNLVVLEMETFPAENKLQKLLHWAENAETCKIDVFESLQWLLFNELFPVFEERFVPTMNVFNWVIILQFI